MMRRLSILFLVTALWSLSSHLQSQVRTKIPIVYIDSVFTGGLDPTDTTNLSFSYVFKDTIWFGHHVNATVCRDTLAGFSTHWTLSDTGAIMEELLPPIGPGGQDIRWGVYDAAVQGCFTDGSKADIRTYVNPTKKDSLRFRTTPNPDPILFHREVMRWPSVLAQYYDSCRIRNVGGPPINIEMTQQSQAISLLFNASQTPSHSFRIVASGPKTPPPTTPTVTLLTPANGATGVSFAPTLTWSAAPGALFYRIQVSRGNPNFPTNTLIANDSLGAGVTSKALIGLTAGTTYYWRVAVFTTGGVSYYQDPAWQFTTQVLTLTTSLLSPANGAQGISTTPQLRWRANGTGAIRYHLRVATDTISSSFIVNDSTLVDSFLTVNLQNCVRYFWRARTFNAQGWGEFSGWFNFRVALATPATPVMVGPADGATGTSLTPTLSWTNDVCTDQTRVLVTADTNGTIVYVYNNLVSGASVQLPTLGQNTTYFWRLRSVNSLPDSSAPSAWRRFTTLLLPPGTPSPLSPANNDSTVGLSPTFTWSAVANADTYTLKVYRDLAFTQKIFDDSTLTGTSQGVSGLENCTRYYWRVKAKNAAGSSAFSAIQTFKTVKSAPGAAALLSPTNGQINVSFTPRMIWSRPDICADYFVVTIARDTGMTNIVSTDTTTDTTIVVGPLLALTKYYWKVAAYNTFQGTSAFNEFSFTVTDQTPPGKPTLSYPANGQDGLASSFTLRWDSTDKASTYRVQVSLDSIFSLLIVNDSTVPQSATPGKAIGPLLNSRSYWWRVNAKNTKGTSEYSDVWKFSTLSPPAAPTLIAPANGSVNVSIAPTLYWTIPERADSYRLQVSIDTFFVQLVRDDSNIVNTNWTVTGLGALRTYYWRVFGKNSVGYGPPSARFFFTTERVGAANWGLPVSICETGPGCDTLTFGINPAATYGIDSPLGEYELPQPPPSGWFDVRFIDARNPSLIGEGLRVNAHPFRSYSQIDTFKLKFQPGLGTYPMTISWNPSFISTICDSMVIKDEYTGAIVHQRMDLAPSVSTNLSSLLIIEYGAFPLPVDVKPPVREMPKGFMLSQNYPNPFNPTTRFDYSTDKPAFVTIAVYDVLGREVQTLVNEPVGPGFHQLEWNGRNNDGRPMPSGVYYLRMLARASSEEGVPFSATRKMIMMK